MTPRSAVDHDRSSSLLLTWTPILLPPQLRMNPPKTASTPRMLRSATRSDGFRPAAAINAPSQMSMRSSNITAYLMTIFPRVWNPRTPLWHGGSLKAASHCSTRESAASCSSSAAETGLSGSRSVLLHKEPLFLFEILEASAGSSSACAGFCFEPAERLGPAAVPAPASAPCVSLSGSKTAQRAVIHACMSWPEGIRRFRPSLPIPRTNPASCTLTCTTLETLTWPWGAAPLAMLALSA
mmetsp:Transcript_13141/g.37522  ORF Transcript_13141/g.37522 Transcript_13141/m.37522 type:complete len:239 (-) Transcript_13141:2343-3059(-)